MKTNEELIPIIRELAAGGMNHIKAILTAIGDNDGWYNGLRILPHFDDTAMFWIIGARRIGKTDLVLRVMCLLYIVFSEKTMWVRNKMVELKDPSFHSAFLNDAKLHQWCPPDWETRPDGVHMGPDKDSDTVCSFQSISTFSNRRGGAHPGTLMMVFDEFCPEDRKYPPMCATGLMSLTKTVFSGNEDARCFCLSNFVSAANPYFVKCRIYPRTDRPITAYPDKSMLIERCTGYRCGILEDNMWNKAYKAAQIGNYASESEDRLIELVKRMPKGAVPQPYIFKIDELLYRGYTKNGITYYSEYHGKVNDIVIWTPNLKECDDRVVLMPVFMRRNIEAEMQSGTLRFKDPNVMFAILNMAFETV